MIVVITSLAAPGRLFFGVFAKALLVNNKRSFRYIRGSN